MPYTHLLYHFVLPYSNWESVTICFSESFESLSEGLQHALWQLGGTPPRHRSDRMSAAVAGLAEGEPPFAALVRQVGGVGYYPRSGQPFVHVDTGNVRHWPRLPEAEYAKILRNGGQAPAKRTLPEPSSIATTLFAEAADMLGQTALSQLLIDPTDGASADTVISELAADGDDGGLGHDRSQSAPPHRSSGAWACSEWWATIPSPSPWRSPG